MIQTAFLGDVVLTLPLLELLAERCGAVDLVTTPAAADLLRTQPSVARVIRFDKRGADRGLRGIVRLARLLRQRRYGRAYLPHGSWRTAAVAALAGISKRVGFSDAPAALTYTRRIAPPKGVHETARLAALAEGERVPPLRLVLTAQDHERAAAWLAGHGIDGRFVALAPGSVWGTKRWPYYPELAALLTDPIVVIGAAEEAALGAAIERVQPGRVRSAIGALSLGESAAVISRAALLVSNDSAPLHLASAVGTPVVAIFGPTAPVFGFGPLGAADVVVEHPGLSCRPCSRHGPPTCPLGHHRCMREVGAERVAEAVRVLVGEAGH